MLIFIGIILFSQIRTSAQVINLIFYIVEHPKPGQFVGNIFESIKQQDHINTLNFESPIENWSEFFEIGKDTGIIRTKPTSTVKLDRERLCSLNFENLIASLPKLGNKECKILLLISINYKIIVSISIIIEDLNDNSPIFVHKNQPLSRIEYNIPEDAVVNTTRYKLPIAIDLDGSSNQIFLYNIIGDHLPFDIEQPNFDVPNFFPQLVVKSLLDFEKNSFYRLRLQACNMEELSLLQGNVTTSCGSMEVCVNIENINDHCTEFENKFYTATLREDALVGSTVLYVRAFDNDKPPFGNVSYYITETDGIPFDIEQRTGRVCLTSYQWLNKQYTFSILATDEELFNVSYQNNHDTSTMDFAQVTVYVIDVNNHSPKIEINYDLNSSSSLYRTILGETLSHSAHVFVFEILEENTGSCVLAYLTVTDDDEGENSVCSCHFLYKEKIPYLTKFELTKVNQISDQVSVYRLSAIKPVDAEDSELSPFMKTSVLADRCDGIAGYLLISIECFDSGIPKLATTEEIFIAIRSKDEFPTTLDNPSTESTFHTSVDSNNILHVFVVETTPVGTEILRFLVEDKDVGSGCIQYQIDKKNFDSTYVDVEIYTGILVLKRELDYEAVRSLMFTMYAAEKNKNESFLPVYVQVQIDVVNANDNKPKVLSPDISNNCDYEMLKMHTFNTSLPVCENLLLSKDVVCVAFNVNEELHNGTAIGYINVTDDDSPDEILFQFVILSTYSVKSYLNTFLNQDFKLAILQRPLALIEPNGELRVAGRIDREEHDRIYMVVQVSDNASLALSSTVIMQLNVLDENDNNPVWKFPSYDDYHISIRSTTAVGSVVTRVHASDADSDYKNSLVEYFIEKEPSNDFSTDTPIQMTEELNNLIYGYLLFNLDRKTGTLTTKRMFLNDTNLSIRIDIVAKDNGKKPLSTKAYLIITVSDNSFSDIKRKDFINSAQNDDNSYLDQSAAGRTAHEATNSYMQQEYFTENWTNLIWILLAIGAAIIMIFCPSLIYWRRSKNKRACQFSEVNEHKYPSRSNENTSSSKPKFTSSEQSKSPLIESRNVESLRKKFIESNSSRFDPMNSVVNSFPFCSISSSTDADSALPDSNLQIHSTSVPVFVSLAVLSGSTGSKKICHDMSENI